MTGVEFLKQYKDVCKRIDTNNMILERKRTYFDSRDMQKTDEYLDRVYSETEDLCRLKHLIELTVERYPYNAQERSVLYERYILRRKWKEISVSTGYSIMHLHRLHNAAVEKLVIPRKFS